MSEENNIFKTLNDINVNDKIEEKNGLKYLSWACAWGLLKQNYPDSFFTIYENDKGWNYHTDGRTAWVKTGVTVCGTEYIEYLPVMDYRNRSIALENVTSMDVTKAIQRSLTKAIGRHGLGLYIYSGEDFPDEELKGLICEDCNKRIGNAGVKTAQQIADETLKNYGKKMCWKCMTNFKKSQNEVKKTPTETKRDIELGVVEKTNRNNDKVDTPTREEMLETIKNKIKNIDDETKAKVKTILTKNNTTLTKDIDENILKQIYDIIA